MEIVRRKRGQSAVIDAVIFFAIMMVVLSSLMYMARVNITASRATSTYYHASYAKATLQALLQCTVNTAYYNDTHGNTIRLEDKSIQELITEDLYLRYFYTSEVDTNSFGPGMERSIALTLRNLTIPEYKYHLWAAVVNETCIPIEDENANIHLGYDTETWSSDLYSDTVYTTIPQNAQKVMIALYVWPR